MVRPSTFWNSFKPNSSKNRRNARSGKRHSRIRNARLGFEPLESRIVLSTNNPVVSVVGPQVFGEDILLHIRDMATFTDELVAGDTPSSDTNYLVTVLITPNPNGGAPAPFQGFATIDNGAEFPGEILGGSFNGDITFANTGVYTVSVTIEDPDGGIGSNSFQVTIEPTASDVGVTAPPAVDENLATGYEGADYVLTLSNNNPNIETINQWTIYWGDGETSTVSGTESTATHVYADDNEFPDDNFYVINAKVSTEDGDFWASEQVNFVRILNVGPVLTIDANDVTDVNEGDQYSIDLSLIDPGDDHVGIWIVAWEGTEEDPFGGFEFFEGELPASASHVYTNGDANYTVLVIAVDEDGQQAVSNILNVSVHNVAPVADDTTFALMEHSADGTVVGTVPAFDPSSDTLTYSVTGGSGTAAFDVDPATGEITVTNSALLDFATTPSFALSVLVEDEDGAVDTSEITINLFKLASISGVVVVDVNQNGLFDVNEGIDGVAVNLLDQDGNQLQTTLTGNNGLYVFNGLLPGTYQVWEQQPTGVADGAEDLGSLGGMIVANDRMQLTLGTTDAFDYAFAEFGQQLQSGDVAGIGFWQNKHGQALIAQGGAQLAVWLTSHFGNVFGNTLVGMTGAQVATFYRDQLFKGLKLGGPAKVDAQFMAVALATYFTDQTLAGQVAAAYGFDVSDTGIGTRIVNVGTNGAAFNVSNGTDRTIMQLLLATNSLTDQPNASLGFTAVYDTDGSGVISSAEAGLRTMANSLFTFINESGGV